MPIKKSELYSSIWASCDVLRGGMDGSQYKDYVLVLLLVKYVSDKYAGQKDALIVIPNGGSFADMVALTKKVANPTSEGGIAYPQSLDTSAKRALYDNLGRNEELAIALDTSIRATRKDGCRGNVIKESEGCYA